MPSADGPSSWLDEHLAPRAEDESTELVVSSEPRRHLPVAPQPFDNLLELAAKIESRPRRALAPPTGAPDAIRPEVVRSPRQPDPPPPPSPPAVTPGSHPGTPAPTRPGDLLATADRRRTPLVLLTVAVALLVPLLGLIVLGDRLESEVRPTPTVEQSSGTPPGSNR
jgi:hypothetical protein